MTAREELEFLVTQILRGRTNWRTSLSGHRSVDALILYGLNVITEPDERDYAFNSLDLARCEQAYEMAPDRMKSQMSPLLGKYREFVKRRYRQAIKSGSCTCVIPMTAFDEGEFDPQCPAHGERR